MFVNPFRIRENDRANRYVRLAPFRSPFRREKSIAYRPRGRVDDRALGESTSILIKGPDYVDPRGPSRTLAKWNVPHVPYYICMYTKRREKLYLLLPTSLSKTRRIAQHHVDIRRLPRDLGWLNNRRSEQQIVERPQKVNKRKRKQLHAYLWY